MERLLSDQPFTIPFEQREDLRDAGVEPGQLASDRGLGMKRRAH